MFALTKRMGPELALLASTLLLLQPVCAAAADHDAYAERCCASPTAPPAAVAPTAPAGAGEHFAAVPHPAQTLQEQASPELFAPPPPAALPPLRYYARSARIRR